MRKLIAFGLLALASLAASAQDGRRYAVLSLVGDKLTVVTREMTTGSHLDSNRRTEVDLPDATIDRAVLLAADEALRRANPGSAPMLLSSRRAALYDAGTLGDSGLQQIVGTVKSMVGDKATHLVLVTKYRHRAMLRLRDGHVGAGFLEGVGFYLDHGSMQRRPDVINDSEAGFIAPYGYLMVSLVELSSGRVLAQQRVLASNVATPSGERNIGGAWQRLSDQEKVARLTEVLRSETARAVPMVLAAR